VGEPDDALQHVHGVGVQLHGQVVAQLERVLLDNVIKMSFSSSFIPGKFLSH
jgi:hypothetical protein